MGQGKLEGSCQGVTGGQSGRQRSDAFAGKPGHCFECTIFLNKKKDEFLMYGTAKKG